MEIINTKQKPFLHLAVVLALSLTFLSTNVRKAECSGTAGALAAVPCNATRISDCLPDDEEFLMESEASRRILQARSGGTRIIYDTLKPADAFNCNGDVYGDCIKGSKNNKRPCNYQNHCARPGNK